MSPFKASDLLLVLCLVGSQVAAPARDREAIQHAKATIVKRLDATLPNKTVEIWLRDVFGSAKTAWEVNDCGEQTGDPRQDRGRDFPMCVDVSVSLDRGRVLHLLLAVGSFKTGVRRQPASFVYACVLEDGAPTRWLTSLAAAANER